MNAPNSVYHMELASDDGSARSFTSWASNFTKCSNAAFENAVNRLWSNSSAQKNVLTVLAAVTKTIQDNDGKQSAAEYYAALLNMLNHPSSTKIAEVYLLKLIMCKGVSDSLLGKTCAEAAKTLMGLTSSDESRDASFIKSIIICLGRLLRAQSADAWSNESIRHIYRHVLRYIDNDKPAVRKASHSAVVDIIGSLNVYSIADDIIFHPACHQTQDHLSGVLREEMKQLLTLLQTKDVHCTRLLHCLNLLTIILPMLPSKDVKSSSECILELVDFPNPLVVSKVFDSIRYLFEHKPSLKSLPVDVAARLLTALYSKRPTDPNILALSINSPGLTGCDVMMSWINAVISGCTYLCDLALLADVTDDYNLRSKLNCISQFSIQRLAAEHLDKLIKSLLSFLITTPIPQLREYVTSKLDNVFTDLLFPQINSCKLTKTLPSLIPNIISDLKNGMNLAHYEVWPHVLALIGRLIRIMSSEQLPINQSDLVDLLKYVIELRDSLVDGPKSLNNLIHVDPANFCLMGLDKLGENIIDGLDRVCLVALENLGPEFLLRQNLLCLNAIVSELEMNKVELRKSWFLPLMSRALPKNSSKLAVFTQYILPLVDRALSVARSAAGSAGTAGSSTNALITAGVTVAQQLWNSLGMFVRHSPLDWSELSVGGFGRRLVHELTTAPALRPIVLSTFRRLAILAADNESALSVMRGGAKLALPAMLSLYENIDPTKQHALKQQIQATLSVYLPLLTSKMISATTATALQKLESTKNPIYIELLQILAPHNSVDEIKNLLTNMISYLTNRSVPRVLCKRAYRLVELICVGDTKQTQDFINISLDEILRKLYELNHINETDLLGSKLEQIKLGQSKRSKLMYIPWKPRLRCLLHLMEHLTKQVLQQQEQESEQQQESKKQNDEKMICELSGNLVENERLRGFVDMFLPEVLNCLREPNVVVRELANRFLINLVNAFAGQRANNNSNFSNLSKANSQTSPDFNSGLSVVKSMSSAAVDIDDDYEIEDEKKPLASMDGLTCMLNDDDDEDGDIMSTKSMPRGSHSSEQFCRAINFILSRLWIKLPPHIPCATNPNDLAIQECAAQSIYLIMKHLRFRRALALNTNCELDELSNLVSSLLNEVCIVSQNLVSSPHRVLVRLGLQLVRLLITYIGDGCVSLIELLQILQNVHKDLKRSMRFVVKAILEKLIKKFGRQTIQSLSTPEHQKIVRNSAKLIARQEKKLHKLVELNENDDDKKKNKDALSNHSNMSRKSKPADLLSTSVRSHLSLPKRVHITRIDEILAQRSDDDQENSNNIKNKSKNSSTRSVRNEVRSNISTRPKSLVEELESVAQTSGLCRRARNRLLNGQLGNDYDNSESDNDYNGGLSSIKRNSNRVRFADSVSQTGGFSNNKLSRRKHLQSLNVTNQSDLWLVENPDLSEILDLSDPKSLAKHTAYAPDDITAKLMIDSFHNSLKQADVNMNAITSDRPHSEPFPIVGGKIVIQDDKYKENLTNKQNSSGWDFSDDDGGMEEDKNTLPAKSFISNSISRANRKSFKSSTQIPGRVYASKKARGDMKRTGLPEPYAFVPLGAGLSKAAGTRGSKFTPTERMLLLKEIGLGKRKRSLQTTNGRSVRGRKPTKYSRPTIRSGKYRQRR